MREGLELNEVQPLIQSAKNEAIETTTRVENRIVNKVDRVNDKLEDKQIKNSEKVDKKLTSVNRSIQNNEMLNSFRYLENRQMNIDTENLAKQLHTDVKKDLNETVEDLNFTKVEVIKLQRDLKSSNNETKNKFDGVEADITAYRKEVDIALKTVRDETDLSLIAIRSETDQALKTINSKLEDVINRITVLEDINENEIGNLTYSLLDECPAGYVQVDGSDIANYPKLRDLLQSFELPDYSDKFLRADNSEDDREIGFFQDDATAVNGLVTIEDGYHVHGIPITDDGDRAHIHMGWANYVHAGDSSGRWGGSGTGVRTDANGKHTHLLMGDDETRPKNVNHILCVRAK